jgi:hypothetical protein
MTGILAAIDLWKGSPRGRLTGTVLFGLMAFSAALKWAVEGAPSPILRGSLIALWLCVATMTATAQEEPPKSDIAWAGTMNGMEQTAALVADLKGLLAGAERSTDFIALRSWGAPANRESECRRTMD